MTGQPSGWGQILLGGGPLPSPVTGAGAGEHGGKMAPSWDKNGPIGREWSMSV